MTAANKAAKAAAQRLRILDRQKNVSENITAQCRYICFGVIAACYAVFTSSADFNKAMLAHNKDLLVQAALFAALALLSDYLQFFWGYFAVRVALKNKKGGYKYKKNTFAYRALFAFYALKQLLACIAIGLFIYTLGFELAP